MNTSIETIGLRQFIETYWPSLEVVNGSCEIEAVNHLRQREYRLRSYLPPQLVRRLDSGFARSNTVHPDTGNALYAICRACKANHVFETGTYWGYSTAYLAAALRDNNATGKVWTFDVYPRAGRHIPKTLLTHVELVRGKPSTETMPSILAKLTPELFFQDSNHDYESVKGELEIIAPHLKPGSVILFHDFVEPQVRRAAQECLADFRLYILDASDPQQLGMAVKPIPVHQHGIS